MRLQEKESNDTLPNRCYQATFVAFGVLCKSRSIVSSLITVSNTRHERQITKKCPVVTVGATCKLGMSSIRRLLML